MQENHFQPEITRDIKARQAARDILGVDEGACRRELKRAWKEARKKHHPDRNPDQEAGAKFILADCAYRFLAENESCEELLLQYAENKTEKPDEEEQPDNDWAFFLWWRDRFF